MEHITSGIRYLNSVTRSLEDLNQLSIFLASQKDNNALKTLRMIILASEKEYMLNKSFDINSASKTMDIYRGHEQTESVLANLLDNPQNYGLELADFIVKYYGNNLKLRKTCPEITNWVAEFYRIEDDASAFYRRYDMSDKKLDIIQNLIVNGLLTAQEENRIERILKECIVDKYGYTIAQLIKMHEISGIIELRRLVNTKSDKKVESSTIRSSYTAKQLSTIILPDGQLTPDGRENLLEQEIRNYSLSVDQSRYIEYGLPVLIKRNGIK